MASPVTRHLIVDSVGKHRWRLVNSLRDIPPETVAGRASCQPCEDETPCSADS